MFINIKAYADSNLVYEANPYDYDSLGTLKGLGYEPNSPLGDNEKYIDELVYEVHPKSDLTGENETFHFVLATGRYKDNRIPPKGFDIANAAERKSEPVWHGVIDPNYFTAAEYTGGYDDVNIVIPKWAMDVKVSLYYQGTSREYVQFLRDEINGTSNTLGDPNAYIIQDTNETFFDQLRAWGDTIWQLWYHNHGLDGSGVSVDCIVPFEMTQANVQVDFTIPGDIDGDNDVDANDLGHLVNRWLQPPGVPSADIAPQTPDGIINFRDFALLAEHWLEGVVSN